MKNVYRFNYEYGRMGTLDGVFISTPEEIETLRGKSLYFGEVLGKHSEVYIENFNPDEEYVLEILEENISDSIYDLLKNIFGSNHISGFCLFDALTEADECGMNDV